MKALLLVDKKRLELTEFPLPAIGPGDLLVRVAACGICGSDVHGYDGSTGRRIPPIVMGHEAAGVVEAAGPHAVGYSPGDRVTFDSTVFCGRCAYCRAGRVNLCDSRQVLGVSCGEYRRHGCFAEFVAIPARIAYRLPGGVSFEQAAMVEAVAVAVHAVGRASPKLGATAVVVGAGMIGQLIIQALRAAGCGKLIAVDPDPSRLETARRFGADHGAGPGSPEIAKCGADLVFEAVGTAESFQTAVAAAGKGGTVALVGNVRPQVELALQSVVTREVSLLGCCASSGEYPACLELMSRGKIDVHSLISEVAPLEQGADWFARLHRGAAGLMKVILRP